MRYFCKHLKSGEVRHFDSPEAREAFTKHWGGTYNLWEETENMTQEEYDITPNREETY